MIDRCELGAGVGHVEQAVFECLAVIGELVELDVVLEGQRCDVGFGHASNGEPVVDRLDIDSFSVE